MRYSVHQFDTAAHSSGGVIYRLFWTDDRRTSTRLVQGPRRRRLPGLAADEEDRRRRFLAAAQQVEQVLVRADQENSVLLQATGRTLSSSRSDVIVYSSCACGHLRTLTHRVSHGEMTCLPADGSWTRAYRAAAYRMRLKRRRAATGRHNGTERRTDRSVGVCPSIVRPVRRNGRAFARDPKGRGFESRPVCFPVTALGKLLTRMCFCHQSV